LRQLPDLYAEPTLAAGSVGIVIVTDVAAGTVTDMAAVSAMPPFPVRVSTSVTAVSSAGGVTVPSSVMTPGSLEDLMLTS
jgi:hypothetical protein